MVLFDKLQDNEVAVPEAGGSELLYTFGEAIFAGVAKEIVANGWSVFPQELDGRAPGTVLNQRIRFSEEYDLKNTLPDRDTLQMWCDHCPTLNVACVFGPASGNTFAIDIDVLDRRMSREIVEIAEQILGYTPFKREGRAPKVALIYRQPANAEDRVANISRKFVNIDSSGNANASEHALEILSDGKILTLHGIHHTVGSYFKWLDGGKSPITLSTTAAPEVTVEQVKNFLEAVDSKWRFHRGASFIATDDCGWDEKSNVRVPKLSLVAGGTPWTEDTEGKITDGREHYLLVLVNRTVGGNRARLDEARGEGRAAINEFKQEITAAVVDQFERTAVMDGRWQTASLRRETKQKVSRLVEKYLSGRHVFRSSTNGRKTDEAFAMPQIEKVDEEIDPLLRPNRVGKGGRKPLDGRVEPAVEAVDLEIPEDREHISQKVQAGLKVAFDRFFSRVYDPDQIDAGNVHILDAPTGAGKTTKCIMYIGEDPRTYEPVQYKDFETGKMETGNIPIAMFLPTYNNIDEVRSRAKNLNLDGNLSDEELSLAAFNMGLIPENRIDERIDDLRRDALNLGLKTMIFSGKVKAGCQMAEKVQLAMEAGIGTSVFCKVKNKDKDGNEVEDVCPFYAGCPAIAQRQEINNAHIVFMPHSFLSLALPDELKNVRAVIADERIHHLFLHTQTFSAVSLNIPRKPPRLTRREREKNENPIGFLADRDHAAKIALSALRQGNCPARALLDYRRRGDTSEVPPVLGPLWVKSALRVCTSAVQRDGSLSPSMPFEEVKEICARPTGRDVREEGIFWGIVDERIQMLQADRLRNSAISQVLEELKVFQGEYQPQRREALERRLERLRSLPTRAQGTHDARIQLITDTSDDGGTNEIIRISWRTTPNWMGVPILLLDASAAPPIIAKIWNLPERDIVVHRIVEDIGKALNVKIVGIINQTFSNSSMIANPTSTQIEKIVAAKNLANVRQALSTVSSLFGDGRVVAGGSIVLRQVINNGWVPPVNMDWCHFGAMRGLDMFKYHSAAISIGRMEVPVRVIDGLVASLTYDDINPELPFDLKGDNRDPKNPGQPLRLPMGEQRIRLRSGHTAIINVPMFPGRWGRLIQRQYREEEQSQFVGRLRPVYRSGRTPIWFVLSSIIPEEFIVDQLVHIQDFLDGPVYLWDAVRRVCGVLEPEVLHKECGDLFKTAEKVSLAAKRFGFNFETGERTTRLSRGFSTFAWQAKGSDTVKFAFALAILENAEETVRSALEKAYKVEIRIKKIDGLEVANTRAMRRPDDKVEISIGSAASRYEKAQERLYKLGELLLESSGDAERSFDIGKYEPPEASGSRQMTIAELDALYAIQDHWNSKSIELEVSDFPDDIISEDDPLNYEHMGANVLDADLADVLPPRSE